MQIGLLESHHRSAMTESRRLVTKACKLRAQRLKSAAAIMGKQGFELSAADLEIVAGMEAGGRWMSRTGTTAGPKLLGNDHDDEEHMGHAGGPVKAHAGAMTSMLFTDVLFKGTHLAAVSPSRIDLSSRSLLSVVAATARICYVHCVYLDGCPGQVAHCTSLTFPGLRRVIAKAQKNPLHLCSMIQKTTDQS